MKAVLLIIYFVLSGKILGFLRLSIISLVYTTLKLSTSDALIKFEETVITITVFDIGTKPEILRRGIMSAILDSCT